MSADARTSEFFAGADELAELCAFVRERRAGAVRPGSEQEINWHALVPADLRKPLSPPLPAGAGEGVPTTAPEQQTNPS